MPVTFELFGKSVSLYYTFWLLGLVAVLLLGYYLGKHFHFGFSKSILYVVGTVLLGYLLLWGTSWVFGGGKLNGLNFVRIVTFLPIPIFLLSWLLKDKYGTVSDFIAPLLAVFHGVTHLGCIFPGCCHGYPSSWGLYSNEAGMVCFPTQPMEAVSSILIGVTLFVLALRGVQKGRLYAWYLLSFGITRFLWEFLRDNEKIWNGISELAFHALGAAVVGVLFLTFEMLRRKGVFNREKEQN